MTFFNRGDVIRTRDLYVPNTTHNFLFYPDLNHHRLFSVLFATHHPDYNTG